MTAEPLETKKDRPELFRLKPSVQEALTKAPSVRGNRLRPSVELTLPEPVYPQFPEKCDDVEPDPNFLPRNGNPYRTRVTLPMISRAMRGWLVPYLRSRLLPGDFHPIIAYLFTEFKCNLACHYCWAFDNRVTGMTEDTALRAINWLHDTGCRVLALMGGRSSASPALRT